jgi:hypothetical protein
VGGLFFEEFVFAHLVNKYPAPPIFDGTQVTTVLCPGEAELGPRTHISFPPLYA